jgi:DNA-binding FadR family transcriptional regulator
MEEFAFLAHVKKMRDALQLRLDHRNDSSSQAFLEADMQFHLAIVDAARNPVLRILYRSFMAAIKDALVPVVDRGLQESDTDRLHADLYTAIAAGDQEAARLATHAHLESTAHALQLLASSTSRE